MRRFQLLLVCCGLVVALGLANAARGSTAPSITSAPGDAAVTFNVTVPPETPPGDTIYVAGDFQNWDPGATPMHRSGNTATVTLMLKPGPINYKYTRGSWAKGEKAADGSELPNRQATIIMDSTLNDTVARWADLSPGSTGTPTPPAGDNPYDSRAHLLTLKSSILGVTKHFYIYTPPGYNPTSSTPYPVLYLFRGHESEWINKNEDNTRNGTNVIDVYEYLLAHARVGPMILVFPGISSDDDSISGLVTNFLRPDLTTSTGVGNGKFEDYLVKEVIPYVDGHYHTIADRAGRGVDGFSLGGFMSAKIAAQHPELFDTAGSFDGTYLFADPTCTTISPNDTVFYSPLYSSLMDPVFGPLPRDGAYAARNNGPNLVCNSTPAAVQSVHWLIQYGAVTCEPNCSNYLRGTHFVNQLTAKGAADEMPQPVLAGGHNWHDADIHLCLTLARHWHYLRPTGSADGVPSDTCDFFPAAPSPTSTAPLAGTLTARPTDTGTMTATTTGTVSQTPDATRSTTATTTPTAGETGTAGATPTKTGERRVVLPIVTTA